MTDIDRIIATIERLPRRVKRFYVSRDVWERAASEMKGWGRTLRLGDVDEPHIVVRMCAVIAHG